MLNSSQLLSPLPEAADLITFSVKVNEQLIPDNYQVYSILTTNVLNRIPTAKLILIDGDVASQQLGTSDQDILSPGNKIEILAGYYRNEAVIFSGIIIRHGVKIKTGQSPRLEIICKDQAIKMTVERKNRYFLNQSDQEIIEEITRDYAGSVSSEVAATNPTHAEMVQYHATDWDFILSRAEAAALVVILQNGKLIAKRPEFAGTAKLVLNYGSSIFEFEAEMDARDQYPQAKATSWDYSKQELLAVQADDNGVTPISGGFQPPGGLSSLASSVASTAMGAVGVSLPGTPPNTDYRAALGVTQKLLQHGGKLSQPELENWAAAQFQKSQLATRRGRVKFSGVADIYPGDLIDLQNVGLRHTGVEYVTAVRHEIQEGNWYTHAQFGVPQEWFLEAYPDACSASAGNLLPAVAGLQVGVVTRLAGDPDGEDRIQVRLPVLATDGEGIWARIAAMDAGAERGAFFRPEINDEVVVGFLGDDPRHAIVLGMLHSKEKAAPLPTTDENHQKGWVTRSGIRFLFDDEKANATLQTPGGNQLLIDDDAQSITIEDQHGNSIVMDSGGITIKSAKDINLEAQGDVNAKGLNINHQAQSSFAAEGASSATLKSEAQTVIKGGIVQIN